MSDSAMGAGAPPDARVELEAYRAEHIQRFLVRDHQSQFVPLMADFLGAAEKWDRGAKTVKTFDFFKMPNDDLRNAIEHIGRAASISPELIECRRAAVRQGASRHWLDGYLLKYPAMTPIPLCREVIGAEISMAAWHNDLAQIHVLNIMAVQLRDAVLDMVYYTKFVLKEPITDRQPVLDAIINWNVFDHSRRQARQQAITLLRRMDLTKDKRPPNADEITKTEDVARQGKHVLAGMTAFMLVLQETYSLPTDFADIRERVKRLHWRRRVASAMVPTLLFGLLVVLNWLPTIITDKLSGACAVAAAGVLVNEVHRQISQRRLTSASGLLMHGD